MWHKGVNLLPHQYNWVYEAPKGFLKLPSKKWVNFTTEKEQFETFSIRIIS